MIAHPQYTLPDHCLEIADGKHGTEEPNHPCNLMAKDFQLPATLWDLLPSDDSLPFS
jgi:hypothetical protein